MGIQLDDLTIGQAKELTKMFYTPAPSVPESGSHHYGHGIIVLDKGFTYKGVLERLPSGEMLINRAYNLRRWGTSRGLQQLVNEGPQSDSEIDGPTDITLPYHSFVMFHPSDAKLWPNHQ